VDEQEARRELIRQERIKKQTDEMVKRTVPKLRDQVRQVEEHWRNLTPKEGR
jgi:hypothetical protein